MYEEKIDAICRVAYMVAYGDGVLTQDEVDELDAVRATVAMMLNAKKAIEKFEQGGSLKQSRKLFKADTTTIIYGRLAGLPNYLIETNEKRAMIRTEEALFAFEEEIASQITDRFEQQIAMWVGQEVASADGEFSDGELQALITMSKHWDISLHDNREWILKYCFPVLTGEELDEDEHEKQNEDELGELLTDLFDVDSVAELLEKLESDDTLPSADGVNSLEDGDQSNFSDLWDAMLKLDEETATDLVKKGADINESITWGEIEGLTPLIVATEHFSMDYINLLMKKDADLEAKTIGSSYTPLIWAIKSEREEVIDALISAGASVNPNSSRQAEWSPLSMAAIHNLPEVVESLIKKGAEINWVDVNGVTALKHAVNQEPSPSANKVAELLLDNGADPMIFDDEGFSVAHNAVDVGNFEVLEKLFDSGVPVNIEIQKGSDKGRSLFFKACIRGRMNIINLLLQRDMDLVTSSVGKDRFYRIDEQGVPEFSFNNLIAATLFHGSKDERDVSDIINILIEREIKPDFIGIVYSLSIPIIADRLISMYKRELTDVFKKHPHFSKSFIVLSQDGLFDLDVAIEILEKNGIELNFNVLPPGKYPVTGKNSLKAFLKCFLINLYDGQWLSEKYLVNPEVLEYWDGLSDYFFLEDGETVHDYQNLVLNELQGIINSLSLTENDKQPNQDVLENLARELALEIDDPNIQEALFILNKLLIKERPFNAFEYFKKAWDMKVTYLESLSGASGKFWEIIVTGKTMTRRWGKLGTDGQTHTKEFASTEVAIAEQEKMIASKKAKGYQ
ncbi:MAG: ankyrin repeat domain-containing protein [Gammaproteobacteria bacterium]|nr:ankyrin repeat domain-containing protein [Gammaproteobacteria bacterium]